MVKGLQNEWGKCSHTTAILHQGFASRKDLIAIGPSPFEIGVHNATTGTCTSVLSGHRRVITSLAFSPDGRFLVSGSCDKTIKLWDIQTGVDVNTFHGHTETVCCVSVSPDNAMIASGSEDTTICLWVIQTGECCHIIGGHNGEVMSVSFSPTNSQLLISTTSINNVQWWDVDGCQVGPTYEGNHVALSSDGALFVLCGKSAAIVRNSDSGVVIAELQVSGNNPQCCCFSPDDKFVVGGVGYIIYIWNITDSNPHLVETLVGHTDTITSLAFSSSLVSFGGEVKFWQIGATLENPVIAHSESVKPASVSIQSITLQACDGITISCDSAGVVKTWDLLTGHCKAFFHIPVQDFTLIDARLINSKLILVWYRDKGIYVWDAEKGELLHTIAVSSNGNILCGDPLCLRISGDGTKVFLQECIISQEIDKDENAPPLVFFRSHNGNIKALDILTGEVVGETVSKGAGQFPGSLITNGSRFGSRFVDMKCEVVDKDHVGDQVMKSGTQWWDFGPLGPTISDTPLDRPHLDFLCHANYYSYRPSKVGDTASGKAVFFLVGGYERHSDAQWDGRYLVVGYKIWRGPHPGL